LYLQPIIVSYERDSRIQTGVLDESVCENNTSFVKVEYVGVRFCKSFW